jgi:hypothetical protein
MVWLNGTVMPVSLWITLIGLPLSVFARAIDDDSPCVHPMKPMNAAAMR